MASEFRCTVCGCVIPATKKRGRGRYYCAPPAGEKRSPCKDVWDARLRMQKHLPAIAVRMTEEYRGRFRGELQALLNLAFNGTPAPPSPSPSEP